MGVFHLPENVDEFGLVLHCSSVKLNHFYCVHFLNPHITLFKLIIVEHETLSSAWSNPCDIMMDLLVLFGLKCSGVITSFWFNDTPDNQVLFDRIGRDTLLAS